MMKTMFLAGLSFFIFMSGLAQNEDVEQIRIERTETANIIDRINAEAARVDTAAGRFTQYNSDGSISSGAYYFKRPGKVRMEYDPPVDVLIVSDGVTIYQEERQLESADRLPIAGSPLRAVLGSEPISQSVFDVVAVARSPDLISVSITDKNGEFQELITLKFTTQDHTLIGWSSTSPEGAETRVKLDPDTSVVDLSPRLFYIEDLRDREDEDVR